MAMHTCPPPVGVAIATMLVRANVHFTLTVHNSREASVECMNQSTLDLVVKQVKADRFNDFIQDDSRSMVFQDFSKLEERVVSSRSHGTVTGRIVREFNPDMHNLPKDHPAHKHDATTQPFMGFPHCTAHVDPASRIPATVGDTPACGMTDTEFDSDPSVVLE